MNFHWFLSPSHKITQCSALCIFYPAVGRKKRKKSKNSFVEERLWFCRWFCAFHHYFCWFFIFRFIFFGFVWVRRAHTHSAYIVFRMHSHLTLRMNQLQLENHFSSWPKVTISTRRHCIAFCVPVRETLKTMSTEIATFRWSRAHKKPMKMERASFLRLLLLTWSLGRLVFCAHIVQLFTAQPSHENLYTWYGWYIYAVAPHCQWVRICAHIIIKYCMPHSRRCMNQMTKKGRKRTETQFKKRKKEEGAEDEDEDEEKKKSKANKY